jgi:hypothetical protein
MNETKNKAIKAAYGKYWEQVKNFTDINGWIDNNNSKFTNGDLKGLVCEYKDNTTFRPKLLQGIEENNGWVLIKSIHDLEIEKGQYFTIYKNGFIEVSYYDGTINCYKFWKLNFTHYKLIIKPKPPIY